MWRFDYPWVFLLLPLAWLAYRWLRPYHEARSALRVPFFTALRQALGQGPGSSTVNAGGWQLLLNELAWVLLLVACARPVLVEQPIRHVQPSRDLMLAIDISQSM